MIRVLPSNPPDACPCTAAKRPDGGSIVNAFTVDVEDYFQVSAFEGRISRDDWGSFELRVETNTRRLLELLAQHGVRATFFVLGWIADKCPALVKEIDGAGHELASHGFWHRLVYSQSATLFREDIRRARRLLQDISGQPIAAFRAPSFSITRETPWAHEILVEEGHKIDSSIFPIHHDRYGVPGASPRIHQVETPKGSLWEFPPPVRQWGKFHLPVGGGGYFRLYPLWWTKRCLRQVNRAEARPFVLYVHPWEIDPEQPIVHGVSLRSRFRHRVNLRRTESRLDNLLSSFRFASISEVLAAHVNGAMETTSQNAPEAVVPSRKPQ